jgi:hypothetical protein
LAISIVNSSTNYGTTGALSLDMPTNTQLGDVLVAWVVSYYPISAPTITIPVGWNRIGTDITSGTTKSCLCYKVYDNNDSGGPWSWTFNNVSYKSGGITSVRGCDPANPIDVSNTGSGATGTTVTVNGITTSNDGSMILFFMGNYYVSNLTFSNEQLNAAAMDGEQWEVSSNVTDSACAYEAQTSAGATGNATASISGSPTAWSGALVALIPATVNPYVVSSSSAVGTGSLTVNAPAGCQAGDILFAFIAGWDNGTYPTTSPPLAGWTIADAERTGYSSGNYRASHACWRAWQPGDTSWTWTVDGGGGSQDSVGVIVCVRGANASSPIDVENGVSSAGGATITVTTITTTAANGLLLFLGATRVNSYFKYATFGTPYGYEQSDDASASPTWTACSYYYRKIAAGATGNAVATCNSTGSAGGGVLIAIEPGKFSSISGSLSSSGVLKKVIIKGSFAGGLIPAGVASKLCSFKRTLTAGISTSGAVTRATKFLKSLTAGLSSSGAVTRATRFVKSLTAGISTTGVEAGTALKSLLAGIQSTGAITKQGVTTLRRGLHASGNLVTEALVSSGLLLLETFKVLKAAIFPTGTTSTSGALTHQLSTVVTSQTFTSTLVLDVSGILYTFQTTCSNVVQTPTPIAAISRLVSLSADLVFSTAIPSMLVSHHLPSIIAVLSSTTSSSLVIARPVSSIVVTSTESGIMILNLIEGTTTCAISATQTSTVLAAIFRNIVFIQGLSTSTSDPGLVALISLQAACSTTTATSSPALNISRPLSTTTTVSTTVSTPVLSVSSSLSTAILVETLTSTPEANILRLLSGLSFAPLIWPAGTLPRHTWDFRLGDYVDRGSLATPEVLGDELLSDPGLEGTYTAGLCDIFAANSWGTPVVAQSTDVHGGSKAQEYTASQGGGNDGISAGVPSTTGHNYRISAWVKRTAGSAGGVNVYLGPSDITRPITSASWTYVTRDYTSEFGDPISISVEDDGSGPFDTVIIDDLSVKEVISPSGVLDLSPGGSGNSFGPDGLLLDGNGWAFYNGLHSDLNELGTQFSLVALCKVVPPTGLYPQSALFSNVNTNWDEGMDLYINVISGGAVYGPEIYNGTDWLSYLYLQPTVPQNLHVVIMTFDNGTLKLFLNGQYEPGNGVGGSLSSCGSTDKPFTLGGFSEGSPGLLAAGSYISLAAINKGKAYSQQEVTDVTAVLAAPPTILAVGVSQVSTPSLNIAVALSFIAAVGVSTSTPTVNIYDFLQLVAESQISTSTPDLSLGNIYNFSTACTSTVSTSTPTLLLNLPVSSTIGLITTTSGVGLEVLRQPISTVALQLLTSSPLLGINRALISTTTESIETSEPILLLSKNLNSIITIGSIVSSPNCSIFRNISTAEILSTSTSTAALDLIEGTTTCSSSVTQTSEPGVTITRSLISLLGLSTEVALPILNISRPLTFSSTLEIQTGLVSLDLIAGTTTCISLVTQMSATEVSVARNISSECPTLITTSLSLLPVLRSLVTASSITTSTSVSTLNLAKQLEQTVECASVCSAASLIISRSLFTSISVAGSTPKPSLGVSRLATSTSVLITQTGTISLDLIEGTTTCSSSVTQTSEVTILSIRNLTASLSLSSTTADSIVGLLIPQALSVTLSTQLSNPTLNLDKYLQSSCDSTSISSSATLAITRLLGQTFSLTTSTSGAALNLIEGTTTCISSTTQTSDLVEILASKELVSILAVSTGTPSISLPVVRPIATAAVQDAQTSLPTLNLTSGFLSTIITTTLTGYIETEVERKVATTCLTTIETSGPILSILRALSTSLSVSTTTSESAVNLAKHLEQSANCAVISSDVALTITHNITLIISTESATSVSLLKVLRLLFSTSTLETQTGTSALDLIEGTTTCISSITQTGEVEALIFRNVSALSELAATTTSIALSIGRFLSLVASTTTQTNDLVAVTSLKNLVTTASTSTNTSQISLAITRPVTTTAPLETSTSVPALDLMAGSLTYIINTTLTSGIETTVFRKVSSTISAASEVSSPVLGVARPCVAVSILVTQTSLVALDLIEGTTTCILVTTQTSAAEIVAVRTLTSTVNVAASTPVLLLSVLSRATASATAQTFTSDVELFIALLHILEAQCLTQTVASLASVTLLRKLESLCSSITSTPSVDLTTTKLVTLSTAINTQSATSEVFLSLAVAVSTSIELSTSCSTADLELTRLLQALASLGISTSETQAEIFRNILGVVESSTECSQAILGLIFPSFATEIVLQFETSEVDATIQRFLEFVTDAKTFSDTISLEIIRYLSFTASAILTTSEPYCAPGVQYFAAAHVQSVTSVVTSQVFREISTSIVDSTTTSISALKLLHLLSSISLNCTQTSTALSYCLRELITIDSIATLTARISVLIIIGNIRSWESLTPLRSIIEAGLLPPVLTMESESEIRTIEVVPRVQLE